MNVEELREKMSESYDKWFERWLGKQDLGNKLMQSAMQGYTAFRYVIDDKYSDYERRRMNDKRFVEKLKENLEGFVVYRVDPERHERKFFDRSLGWYWTDPKVVISWVEKEE